MPAGRHALEARAPIVERCVRGIEAMERVVRSRAFSRFTYGNHTR